MFARVLSSCALPKGLRTTTNSSAWQRLRLQSNQNDGAGVVSKSTRIEPKNCIQRNERQGLSRRSLGLLLLGSSGSVSLSPDIAYGDENVAVANSFAEFKDSIHAYKFDYPAKSPESGSEINWVVTRQPERYSSAAPLAPDARARIVFQQLSLKEKVVCAVYISPADRELALKDSSDWTAKEVAYRILTDKGSSRLGSGQRIMDDADTLEESKIKYKDQVPYYQFEVSRSGPKSSFDPNPKGRESFTHLIYTSVKRDDFFYTVAFSVPEWLWPIYQDDLVAAADSFMLVNPGEGYIPPDSQPWKFW